MFSGYVGYYLLGLFLGRINFSPKKILLAIFLFFFGFLFTFFVFFLNLPPRDNETVFRSYLSLNIVLMSSAAFFSFEEGFARIALLLVAQAPAYELHHLWYLPGSPTDIGAI